jgi:hypothetical protein
MGEILQTIVLLTSLLTAEAREVAIPSAPTVEAWAGHQVLKGKRKIPIYGEKETHTENFFIAEVHRSPGRIDVLQKLCRIDIGAIKGVKASMSSQTVARLPKARFVLEEAKDGTLTATPWKHGWGDEDIDSDDHPGATVQITGSRCSGDVYVSNASETSLVSGRASEDGVSGQISVRLKQRILGATGLCLKLVAGDSDETQTGWFAYRRVPIGTSCRTLANQPWPVKAGPVTADGK